MYLFMSAEMVRSTDRKRVIKEDIPARRPFTDITNQDRTVKKKEEKLEISP